MLGLLVDAWADTVARICIGLRRLGTGGSLLITSTPKADLLDLVHPFRYRRLGDSTILNVLDAQYLYRTEWKEDDASPTLAHELGFAQADAEDRAYELTGAVKIVTSLATADGLVLLDQSLGVLGFGVKIRSGGKVNTVYEGEDFARRKTRAKKINTSRFGTRHSSILRYCQTDRNAIGVVVSQDGHTRVIMSVGRSLTMWDNVKLLGYHRYFKQHAKMLRRIRLERSKSHEARSLGYTAMPKTIRGLLSYGKQ